MDLRLVMPASNGATFHLFGVKHDCDELSGGPVQSITIRLESHQLGETTFETRPGVHNVVAAFTEGEPEEAIVTAQAGLGDTVTTYVGTGGTVDITELQLAGSLFVGTADLELTDTSGGTVSLTTEFTTFSGCTNDDAAE